MAGPLPGLLIGLFFIVMYGMTQQPLCFEIAVMFLFLNAFNLLPFYPLDGGSFFDLVLFSRHYVIELAFKVITSLLLIALGLFLKAWALLLIPFFVLVSLKTSYYVHKAAKRVKADLPYQTIETLTLTEELVGKIRTRIDEKAFGNRTTLKNLASLVDATWQRVFNIPPRPFKTTSDIQKAAETVVRSGLAALGLITNREGAQFRTWWTHGIVHWIGMDVHDVGNYSVPLAPGMAFAIEAGLYVREAALENLPKTAENLAFIEQVRPVVQKYRDLGVRIEDSFLLTGTGLKHLSANVPRTVEELERFMRTR